MFSDNSPNGGPVSEAVKSPGQEPSAPQVGEVGTSAPVPSKSRLGPPAPPPGAPEGPVGPCIPCAPDGPAGPDGPEGPVGPDGPFGPGPSSVIAVSPDLQDFPTAGKRIL